MHNCKRGLPKGSKLKNKGYNTSIDKEAAEVNISTRFLVS